MTPEIKDWFVDKMLSGISDLRKLAIIDVVTAHPSASLFQLEEYSRREIAKITPQGAEIDPQMILYGNVWSRKMYYPKAGDRYAGHTHAHDHVTFLLRGGVRVQVEGYKPRDFWADDANTWIVIPAEHEHQFIALTDNTLAMCVHAVRDLEGEVYELTDVSNLVALEPTEIDPPDVDRDEHLAVSRAVKSGHEHPSLV